LFANESDNLPAPRQASAATSIVVSVSFAVGVRVYSNSLMGAINHKRDPENTEPWKSEIGNLFPCVFVGTTGPFYEHANAIEDIMEPFKTLKVFIPRDMRNQLGKVQEGILRLGVPHFLDLRPVTANDAQSARPCVDIFKYH